ncbi:MAG TPA: UvrD-helicase domain-containing protein [Verrucomicrobiota bacterium]|nr:UvrD-helicase domain-containing protein [Verrucomicrobiota bacterium]HNU51368.1 UvrD-helicase domain-containing protein [Verrucomicrobiota bacterium]
MNPRLQHTSIRASAGTGKTYQLANRYLALLLLQATPGGTIAPDRLVAVTFTRKGAGEFAQRILRRLAEGAGNAQDRGKLKLELTQLVQGDPAHHIAGLAPGAPLTVDAATLQSALATTIDQFDRLALGTIDSFMARSIQTLAFELGLGGFEILEDADIQQQREEILDAVFHTASKRGLDVFYQTLKQATLKSSTSLRYELNAFIDAYHDLVQTLPDADAWGGPAFWNGTRPQEPQTPWRDQAAALARETDAADFGHANIKKSVRALLDWIAHRSPGTPAGTVPSWIDQDGRLTQLWPAWPQHDWTFDYSRRPRTLPASFMTPLRAILEAWIAAECHALANKTSAIHDLVAEYELLYDRLARRRGRLAFADLPVLLDEATSSLPAGDAIRLLGFRWFQRFDHWMLDEFQDTSRVQWNVLKPWLDEAIQDDSGAKSVFVVGDPKQAIYGWRGGEPRLLDELHRGYPGAFSEHAMAESWRSRPSVLDLVNRVCTPDSNPALRNPDQFSPAALQRWRYDSHAPTPDRSQHPGYATVLQAPTPDSAETDADSADPDSAPPDKLAPQARVILDAILALRPLDNGQSCAILVRKNQSGQAIAQWLRAHGLPQVIVEGATTLTAQSPVAAAILDALRWIATPADSLAAGHIQLTALWNVLTQPLGASTPDTARPGDTWQHWRHRIADLGAPTVTAEWCNALAANKPDPCSLYCLREIAQAAQLAGPAMALPEWTLTLEQLTVTESASAGSIHILTIHKAKGLGFDIVFLPDLDRPARGRDQVLIRRDGQGHPLGCLAHPPQWLQAWVTPLKGLADAQQAEDDLENLCLLYVALTRAKEATFVILGGSQRKTNSRTREWILAAVTDPAAPIPPVSSPWGQAQLLWEHGTRQLARPPTPDAPNLLVANPSLQLPTPAPRKERRRPSDAGHAALAASQPPVPSNTGLDFGTAVHHVFEQIEWSAPDQPLDGEPDAVALVRRCLESPDIHRLFAPETPADEAHRELPVEYVDGDVWWSGILDRLVLRRDLQGQLLRAIVIDFKTDRVDSAVVLQERYESQLTVYRRAVSAALRLPPNTVDLCLVSTHLRSTLYLP